MSQHLLYGVGAFIPVSDLKASTSWYQNMFGFEVLHQDEPEANTLRMSNGVVIFCLVKSQNISQPKFPENNYSVNQYFNFLTTDVEKIHQELQDKGASTSEIHQFDGLRGFDLYDPDGNKFGVVE